MMVPKLTIHFILGFALLCCRLQTYSQTQIEGGEVHGEWQKSGSPYIVNGDILIPEKKMLMIESGTKIIFNGQYSLTVKGSLKALGKENSQITITCRDSIAGWKGIKLIGYKELNDSSYFVWCNFLHGNATIENIENCKGGAININAYHFIKIERCNFYRNKALSGGALYVKNSNLNLEGCRFESNKSFSDGGAICFVQSKVKMYNNILFNNSAFSFGGALMIQNMKAKFANNLIVENKSRFGAGLALINDSSTFLNNTIASNSSSSNGGGIHLEKSTTKFINSILWGNQALIDGKQGYLFSYASPQFSYCNLQDGMDGINLFTSLNSFIQEDFNNIDANPSFIMSDTSMFALAKGSPCIDYGISDTSNLSIPSTDINYRNRIQGKGIDLGAYEFNNGNDKDENFDLDEFFNEDEQNSLQFAAFPNPSYGEFNVLVSNPEHKRMILRISNASGSVIIENNISNSNDVFALPVKISSKPGVYIMTLTDEQKNKLKEKKIVVN